MFDIVPPKLAHKIENTIKDLERDNKKKKHHKGAKNYKKERHIPLKEVFVGGTIIIFLFGIYLYNNLPKADIEIWPKIDTLTLQEKITADKSVNSLDLLNKVIPAQYVEVQKDSWQEFPATGSASNNGKASGTIKVYNKINSNAFTLIKGTHFLSDSGKYFVTLEKIVIPGAQKNLPGSVNAKVQAEESGTDYNIGASKFSVPKLYGTPYYYSIWAESNSEMTGGYTGQVKKVTDDDIQKAKDALTKNLLIQAKDSLKGKLAPDDILLDSAMVSSIVDSGSDVKSGAIADKFNESAKVKIFALVFKKQDLEKFVKNDILSQLAKDNNFLEKSLNVNYNPEAIDIKEGKLILNLQSSVKIYQNINTNDLIDLLSMKSGDQIKQTFDQIYDGKISEIKVNFWPFWVKKAPEDRNRIKIKLNFE